MIDIRQWLKETEELLTNIQSEGNRNALAPIKPRSRKNCNNCGGAHYKKGVYCSNACRQSAYRQRKRLND